MTQGRDYIFAGHPYSTRDALVSYLARRIRGYDPTLRTRNEVTSILRHWMDPDDRDSLGRFYDLATLAEDVWVQL